MGREEIKVIVGCAGFRAGILLGFGLFGFPVRGSDLPAPWPRLDRDARFEAMRGRRHFGTTGNRMVLDVAVGLRSDGELFLRDPALFAAPSQTTRRLIMGDIARVTSDEVDLAVDVIGSAPIERIDIFDGLDLIETVRPFTADDLGRRVRLVYEGAEYRGRARTTVWDGSLEIADNAVLRAEMINNWSLDRGIQSQDAGHVVWKAVTTGNYGAIDLWLESAGRGRLAFHTGPESGAISIAELGIEAYVFAAGGLDRAIKLQRLPEKMTQTRVVHHRTVKVRSDGDTRLYIRVQQEDGHRAWSSPIYIFRN